MNAKQYEFVMQYLQHKDKITAYTIAYNKRTSNYRAVESAANRLLQNPEIKQYIANMRESMYNEAMQEVQKELKTELLTVHRKREVLARIVNGEHSVIQNFKGKNCQVCTYFLYPTIREILQGIREDNRMAGHYPSPAVASAKAGKNAKTTPPENTRYLESISKLAQTPLPVRLARFAQNGDDVAQSRTYRTTTIPQPASPLQGDRGKLAPGTPEPQSRTYRTTTILQPVSPLQGDRGKLAPGTPEPQSRTYGATTILRPASPLQGDRGKFATGTPEPQQSATNIGKSPSGGFRGPLPQGTPEPQSRTYGTTTILQSASPLQGDRGKLAPGTPEPQSRTYGTTTIPQPASPLQGDRGKFATDTPESQSRTYGTTTILQPASPLQGDRGKFAPGTPETSGFRLQEEDERVDGVCSKAEINNMTSQQSATTIPQPVSPLQADREKFPTETPPKLPRFCRKKSKIPA